MESSQLDLSTVVANVKQTRVDTSKAMSRRKKEKHDT